ncbi:MAG: MFS transporter [Candidatus Parcubacteria bacterium]|nr:MFS transporter [Candidatus Parcubacteria bacterium]
MTFFESNTPKLLTIALLQALTFYAAFEKIFFFENGLSIFQIGILTMIFSLFIIIFEVPSGALSDRWVRKHVLSLSLLSSGLSLFFFATGSSFLGFAIGIIFAGSAFVLNSGTNTSLLFDSLQETGDVSSFEKLLAIRRILSGAGFATASLIGGFMANKYGIEITIWATLITLIPALLLCLSLKEPHFHKTTGELNYFNHIRYAAAHLSSSKYFLNVIMLSVVVMTTNILIEDYAQLYFFALGFSLLSIGILSFFEGAKEMIANYIGSLFSNNRNLPGFYGFLLIIMSGSLLVSSLQHNLIGVAGLFIASAMFFMIDVPLLGNFHKQLDSKIRATSESFLNLVTEFSKMLLAFAFAGIATVYSIESAFGALGILVAFYTAYYWLFTYAIFKKQEIQKNLS